MKKSAVIICLWGSILGMGALYGSSVKHNIIDRTQVHMGTFVTLSLSDKERHLFQPLFEKITVLESYFSTFAPSSELSILNKVQMISNASIELLDILRCSKEIQSETNGYFNIAVGSVTKKLYRFGYDDASVPTKGALEKAFVPQKSFVVDQRSVRIEKNTTLDLGGIAKGYTVDALKKILDDKNIEYYKIALSGDIYCKGSCTVAIASPFDKQKSLLQLKLMDSGISTSGNYERYIKNKTHNHLIDPMTKHPQQTIASITLISKTVSNTRLDAYATALSVMPDTLRERFLNAHKDIDYIVVYTNGSIAKRLIKTAIIK